MVEKAPSAGKRSENTAAKEGAGAPPKGEGANKPAVAKRKPAVMLYFGLASMLAWFYAIWFVPQIHASTELLDWSVTIGWLVMLAVSGAVLAVVPIFLRARKLRLLQVGPWPAAVSSVVLAACGLWYCLTPGSDGNLVYTYGAPAIMGIAFSFALIEWGEWYSSARVSYHIGQVALSVGGLSLAVLLLMVVLPSPTNAVVAALLPLTSCALLISVAGRSMNAGVQFPRMLAREDEKRATNIALQVSAITAVSTAACYFVVAIIPVPDLPYDSFTFAVGALIGETALIVLGIVGYVRRISMSIFKTFPWMLVVSLIAVALYLPMRADYYPLAYYLAMGLSLTYSTLLIMYIGGLSSHGYLWPSWALGMPVGFVHVGIFAGNGIAVLFEHNAAAEALLLEPVTIAFIVALAVLIIPLVRREQAIVALTAPIASPDQLDAQIASVTAQFGLSKREAEVLALVVRGYTAAAIGDKLYISSYTAQTHIQHIYAKTDIHKKSELIDYVTKQQTTNVAAEQSTGIDELPAYWPLPS